MSNRFSHTLHIVGLHALSRLPEPAIEAIKRADKIYGGDRHQQILRSMGITTKNWQHWSSPIAQSLDQIGDDLQQLLRVVVIASGDPMCYGIGNTIIEKFPELSIQSWPAPSSFSLSANLLGWPLHDCQCISLHHGSNDALLPAIYSARRVLCLTKNAETPKHIVDILCTHNLGNIPVYVLENLMSKTENVIQFTAQDLLEKNIEFSALNTVAIDLTTHQFWMNTPPIFHADEDLENDGLITKFCYRSITLATLNPRKNAILWDIGAGSGSISLGWSALGGRAYAVESNKQRQEIIQKNAERLNIYSTKLMATTAEEAINQFPEKPDVIFMGGALHLLDQYADKLSSGSILVANAVTLNSQKILIDRQQRIGGKIRKIHIEEQEQIGAYSALKPYRSVLQYYWKKP